MKAESLRGPFLEGQKVLRVCYSRSKVVLRNRHCKADLEGMSQYTSCGCVHYMSVEVSGSAHVVDIYYEIADVVVESNNSCCCCHRRSGRTVVAEDSTTVARGLGESRSIAILQKVSLNLSCCW